MRINTQMKRFTCKFCDAEKHGEVWTDDEKEQVFSYLNGTNSEFLNSADVTYLNARFNRNLTADSWKRTIRRWERQIEEEPITYRPTYEALMQELAELKHRAAIICEYLEKKNMPDACIVRAYFEKGDLV